MKKLLIIGFMALTMASCSNNDLASSAIPDEVVTSFNQRYPYATDVNWGEDNGLYEAKFKEGGNEKEAFYRSDGTLVKVDN